jgi:hypothetical protein
MQRRPTIGATPLMLSTAIVELLIAQVTLPMLAPLPVAV